MRNKMQSLSGSKQARDDYEVIEIVQLIQGATFNFENHTYLNEPLNEIHQKK